MNNEQLNALKERAYKTAVAHGFHEEVKPNVYYLGLVMSEAGEAINADRRGWHADTKGFEEKVAAEKDFLFDENFVRHIKDTVEDEIADIVIRLLDFAGLKKYRLSIMGSSIIASSFIIVRFPKEGLPGTLFTLNRTLRNALDRDFAASVVCVIINILSDCFETMTGSDKDLWWFVEQKMRYNELRPKLNGKKY